MQENLKKLNERIRALPPSPFAWEPCNEVSFGLGQVWSVTTKGEEPTWLLVVVENLFGGFANLCPMFLWTELSGPDDVIVPSRVMGTELVVSLGLEATLGRDTLGECHGRIPPVPLQYILEARLAKGGKKWTAYRRGMGYLDEYDRRLAYNNTISERLEVMQAGILDKIMPY